VENLFRWKLYIPWTYPDLASELTKYKSKSLSLWNFVVYIGDSSEIVEG
jgi:hypothetical protein